MNDSVRRLFQLVAVFAVAFGLVLLVRQGLPTWLGGGPEYRPESFTLAEKAPLELDQVELLARLDDEYARLTDAVVPSVVSLDTVGMRAEGVRDPFGRRFVRQVPTQGQGSGVIVSEEGHVVTNHHVIRGQQKIQIRLHDGRTYPASLIGDDPLLDIAVLRIDGGGDFQPLKFGDSDRVRRGQLVFAIGNPFGLGETITQGIISALERSLSDSQRDLFQTDAAINPGNSGGPLVNLQGEIIGINSAIYRPDERVKSGFQGVGFSIPSNDVRETIEAILERGRPVRGFLGVHMLDLDLDPGFRQRVGYDGPGARVVSVGEGSPAQKAGLQRGDVITAFDGETVRSMAQLFTRVQRAKVGEEVEIQVWRDGQLLDLTAVIEEASAERIEAAGTGDRLRREEHAELLRRVGLVARDPKDGRIGVVVTEILSDSLAAGRVIVGDRVIAVNGRRILSVPQLQGALVRAAAESSIELRLIRGLRGLQVTLPVP